MKIGALLKKLIEEGHISDPASPKGRLLAEAAKLFREKGYNRTTVRDIAAEVGILSGSIFHHFKNKDEILFGVMNQVVRAMDEAIATSVEEADTTSDKIRALIDTELRFIHGKTANATAVLIYEWRSLSEEYRAQVLEGRRIYFEVWQNTLAQAYQEGLVVVEPKYLRQLLHGAIAGTSNWYRADGELTFDELTDRILTLAIK